jgi:hypothetical protein
MRLYLINPSNPLVSIVNVKESRWNRYRVWKPLSLLVLAGMTTPEWEISILDENLGVPDYQAMPLPDLVGITAFTSQANRAYELAGYFQRMGVIVDVITMITSGWENRHKPKNTNLKIVVSSWISIV